MSLMFDRSNSEACAASYAEFLAAPDLPISVTCWVYVDDQPGDGDTHTVWWFGRDGINSQFLKLVFRADGQSDIMFQAAFQASNNSATATASGYATGTWHCVSVVIEQRTNPSEYRLRLYVDDNSPVDASTTASGATVNDYDVFALGRASGATKTDYASCRIEQVAAWQDGLPEPALGESDNTTMFTGRMPPRDAKDATGGLEIGRAPDLAYWILAGHGRSGLRINSSQGAQLNLQRGELVNELGAAFPVQQIQVGTNPPRWSSRTPIFRWKDLKNPQQEIQNLPPKAPRSRLLPRFIFFSEPVLNESSKRWPKPPPNPEPSPVWNHPNFDHLGQTQFHNAGALRPTPGSNEPRSDLAVVAATMADWLAFQGFAAGTGSAGGGQYEGSLYLRGLGRGEILGGFDPDDPEKAPELLGWDRPVEDATNPFGVEGAYTHIPLLQHPFDHIDQVTSGDEVKEIWNVWYRNNGVALCREWSEHFWQALKEELDERGLCYPARLHWDYEDQPDWNTAMRAGAGTAANPIGNWDQMIADSRFSSESSPVYIDTQNNERTLQWVDATRGSVAAPVPNDSPWGQNIAATNWLAGWVVLMRNSGLFKGVIEPALGHFQQTLWGNYQDIQADNPGYPYPRRGPNPGRAAFSHNTPEVIHADFSAPVFYAFSRRDYFMREDSTYHYGATPSSVNRGLIRARVDSCVNARTPLPVVAWIGGPLQNFANPTYETTFEDSFDGFAYAWKRGVDEFVVFDFGGSPQHPNDAWDQAWFACNRLLDQVHMLPQATSGARVARMSRLGRRQ